MWSLPSWERGLKHIYSFDFYDEHIVAPLVGAWIETPIMWLMRWVITVAPLVGAWIET